ncbi:MAG: cyclic nucleotide-binding domain-containing protein [Thermoanaerobaculia bacterium]|nr:cyclic nucleotide-binding domain-containing protein [Thermoanaerobaculia bacterium]
MKAVFKSTGSPGGTSEPGKEAPSRETPSFPGGSTIFQEGDLGTEMFIILEGRVRIEKKIRGETHLLSTLEKGDFFGEMGVLENAPRSADAVAESDCKLLAITGSRFDEMIRKNPEIAVRIIRKYATRLREANVLLERLAGPHIDPEAIVKNLDPVELPPDLPATVSGHRLVDITSGNPFFLSTTSETTIGRADPVTGIRPDIDLADCDTNRSVSRRHAKILRTEDGYAVIEEVGTVNGTFVNDQRIPTGTPVPVKNGDRVKIGLIQMRAVFE